MSHTKSPCNASREQHENRASGTQCTSAQHKNRSIEQNLESLHDVCKSTTGSTARKGHHVNQDAVPVKMPVPLCTQIQAIKHGKSVSR